MNILVVDPSSERRALVLEALSWTPGQRHAKSTGEQPSSVIAIGWDGASRCLINAPKICPAIRAGHSRSFVALMPEATSRRGWQKDRAVI